MKYSLIVTVLVLMAAPVMNAKQKDDLDIQPIKITARSKGSSVFPTQYLAALVKQQTEYEEIGRRLDSIDGSIKDMQGDIKELRTTQNVMDFIVGSMKLLIPGLVITAFGVWFARQLNKPQAPPPKPKRA